MGGHDAGGSFSGGLGGFSGGLGGGAGSPAAEAAEGEEAEAAPAEPERDAGAPARWARLIPRPPVSHAYDVGRYRRAASPP